MNEENQGFASAFDWNRARITHRGYFPHLRQDNIIYFVTFRQADSISVERRKELLELRKAWLVQNPPPHNMEQEKEYRRIWTTRIENLLDAGLGSCVFRNSRNREILEETMRHDDGIRYQLGEFVIMPNHVHALVRINEDSDLSNTIGTWKSISARRVGKETEHQKILWKREYFDHAVRDEHHHERFVAYIQENPRNLKMGEYTVGRGSLKV